jgi:two-component system, chemotaxis family, sensor kinase CheA
MIMIRGTCYPIIRLHRLFEMENCVENIEDGILLLVDAGDHMACIFADGLVGKHQVVVKPLPTFLNRYSIKSSGIAGCTILGDGGISLILDAQGILNR